MSEQTDSTEQLRVGKTKLLMISSAIYMGLIGMFTSFTPEILIGYYNMGAGELGIIVIKMVGALYLGFSALNWMAKGNIIGAIYSRPVAFGNFFHFMLIAILLLKYTIADSLIPSIAIIAGINSIFALSFGYLLFGSGKGCINNACG